MSERSAEMRVRLGFIGCGNHAREALYPALRLVPEIDLIAVCDIDEKRRLQTQREFGALRAYAGLHTMLDAEGLDAICIVGPPQMQHDLGIEVLRRYRLPILVEKPSALSYAQALELAETAASAGTFGMTGFMKRFAPAYAKAYDLSQREAFGRVTMIDIRYTHGPYPRIWGLSPEPYCCLVGNDCHVFDLARFFGGDVAQVDARLWYPGQGGAFAFAIILAFINGAVGTLNCNGTDDSGWVMRETCAVSGIQCSVEIEDMTRIKYRGGQGWADHPDDMAVWNQGLYAHPHGVSGIHGHTDNGYVGELRHFARCVLGLEQPRPTLLDGAESLKLAEAIWTSARSRLPVDLSG